MLAPLARNKKNFSHVGLDCGLHRLLKRRDLRLKDNSYGLLTAAVTVVEIQQQNKIPIIYEHDDFIVLNKPAGISVHDKNDAEDPHPGIVTLVKQQTQYSELWLVHRLDKVTSGCLILAKNAATATALGEAFEQRKVQKFYLAITDKKPKKRQGSVIGDLKKVRDGKWIITRERHNPSVTHFFDKGYEQGMRLQILKPYTGQTHQLRVVMSSLGATILRDQHYNGSHADRTYLHAWQIKFPLNGVTHQFQCLPLSGEWFTKETFTSLIVQFTNASETFAWPDKKLIPIALKKTISSGKTDGNKG